MTGLISCLYDVETRGQTCCTECSTRSLAYDLAVYAVNIDSVSTLGRNLSVSCLDNQSRSILYVLNTAYIVLENCYIDCSRELTEANGNLTDTRLRTLDNQVDAVAMSLTKSSSSITSSRNLQVRLQVWVLHTIYRNLNYNSALIVSTYSNII